MSSFFSGKRLAWLLVSACLVFCSCQVSRFFIYNFADINDYKKFPSRRAERTATSGFHYACVPSQKFLCKTITYKKEKNVPVEEFIRKHKTVAFLVVKNDTIIYEKYFRGKDSSSYIPSFSMAKSFTSALIGCAIHDGYIKSVSEPVTNYIPELKKNGFDSVTIEHLLQMTSGIDFNENYFNPFGSAAAFYYGTDLKKKMKRIKLKRRPGTKFEYVSGNSQLLGWVLERALKEKTLTQYLQEKIWQPLGMESDATWSTDRREGMEKTFCCLNSTARDFSRFGRLYLNKGKWEGQQIIPEQWVKTSTRPDTSNGAVWYYRYQWWLESRKLGDYTAHGFLGQYIYVWPAKKIVIVRLGKTEGGVYWPWIFWLMCKDL